MLKPLFFLAAAVLAAACNTVPPTNVHQPMTVRPPVQVANSGSNGSIFQAGQSRPLFEDRRARYLGDTLTINIVEKTSASLGSNNSANRTGSNTASVDLMTGLPGMQFSNLGLSTSSKNSFEGKGAQANNNTFTGTITVTVIEVLSNGNLLVSGEKQLGIGKEQEFIRLSGVVNPAFVTASNMVDSSRVADARIEYKSAGAVSEAETMGWMARFFLNVLPF